MITLKGDEAEEFDSPDPGMVERLTHAAALGMEKATVPELTTPSEILSAAFTLLSRTLQAMKNLEAPEDAKFNAASIRAILEDFIVQFGSLPN